MTAIQLNNGLTLLSYGTTSYFQALSQKLRITSSPSTLLLNELNSQDDLSYPTLLKVVAFLADHPHARLEQALKEKLAQTTPSQGLSRVQAVSMFSLLHDSLKMLDVCKRIVTLDQLKSSFEIDDAMAIAQRESPITPKPTRTIEKISDTAIRNWHRYSSFFGKIVHWFQAVLMGTFIAVGTSILSPLENPPSSILEIQGYFQVYRYIIDGFTSVTTTYLEFFSTTKMAALAGIVILISAIAINHIHKQFRLGVPEQIDKRNHFKNTSIEAQKGKIKKMKGRQVERDQVRKAWGVARDEKFRIVLLVGPTGCGKTEFVNGLAWESMNDPDSFVYRKKIFTINTIKLVKEGSNYLDKILRQIEGHEDDIVLFFDEGHSAGSQEGKIGPLIEALKTILLDKNIRGIFATTNKEYETHIQHNEAFVDRCTKVDFKELPDAESKKILKDKVQLDVDRLIEVDADAYDALLSVAAANPKRYNPRKVIDLHKDVRSYVYNWKPKALRQTLDRLTDERDNLDAFCTEANNNSDWSNSPEGISLLAVLREKERQVLELTQAEKNQNSELRKIARLRNLGPHYRKQYNEVVHQVVAEKKPVANKKLQKEFLYLKHILRPALQATLESEVSRMSATYQEELPLKIDAALINRLYRVPPTSPRDVLIDVSPHSSGSPISAKS